MKLCVDTVTSVVHYADDGISCESLGYVTYLGGITGHPDLSLSEIDALFGACLLLWAIAFGLRLLRSLLPKQMG